MSIPGSASPLFLASTAAAGAYDIPRSLRFNSADSSYLNRTPSSAGNRKTWTWSGWVKITDFSQTGVLFFAGTNSDNRTELYYNSSDNKIYFLTKVGGFTEGQVTTDGVLRDPSAWYHIVFALDTTASPDANRALIYINGVEQSTASPNVTNTEHSINNTVAHYIGRGLSGSYFNGYLADVHLIDGQALAPTDFGEYDDNNVWQPIKYAGTYGTNGFKLNFSDTSSNSALGTDSSGAGNNWSVNNLSVAAGAGNDALRDSPVNGDSANDTGAGGEITGNYATWNPLGELTGGYVRTLTDGNLTAGGDGDSIGTITFGSGKTYFELTVTSATGFSQGYYGIVNTKQAGNRAWGSSFIAAFRDTGALYGTSSTGSAPAAAAVGTIYGIAVDVDNQKMFISVNGTWLNSGNPASGTGASFTGRDFSDYAPLASLNSSNAQTITLNTGQRAFHTAAPSGYKCLCTANLSDPTIEDGSTAFDAKTFTANNGTQTVSGFNFSPDLIWTKSRANAYAHQLWDQVRGANKALMPNEASAEANLSGSLAFTSDGFTSGTNNNANYGSGGSIAWAWDAGDNSNHTYAVTVSNPGSGNKFYADGALQPTLTLAEGSTYKFDQSSGTNSTHPLRFSTTSDGTHGGGSEYTTGVTTSGTPGSAGAYTQIVIAASAPTLYAYCTAHSGMGFQVNTSDTAGYTIPVGSVSSGVPSISSRIQANPSAGFSIVSYTATSSTGTIAHGLNAAPAFVLCKKRNSTGSWWAGHVGAGWTKGAYLQVTDAFAALSGFWNNTAPDNNVVSLGSYPTEGSPSATYVAYCFAPVEGYSSFGSYVGNGSADGPFVYTGFRPAFILIKNSSATAPWYIYDSTRETFNPVNQKLYADHATAEGSGSGDAFDLLSNGFKSLAANSAGSNVNGQTFIYAAFAEHPFKTSRAR